MNPKEMPASLPVHAALEPVHEKYDVALIDTINALYDSREFVKRKQQWLTPRSADATSPGYLNARVACASYVNEFAAKLDDVCGEVLSDPPRIVIHPGINDPRAAFWERLNENADGCGNDLKAVAENALLETLKHGRAYFIVKLPGAPMFEGSLFDVKASGAMEFKIGTLDAREVEDWEYDAAGNLVMLRHHCMELERTKPYLPANVERHTWTFFRSEGVYTYVARRPYQPVRLNIVGSQGWSNRDVATLQSFQQNPLECINVFPLACRDFYSLGHRLQGPARGLFNASAARSFAIEKGSLNMPVVATAESVKNLVLNECGFINVGLGGSFKWGSSAGKCLQRASRPVQRFAREFQYRLRGARRPGRRATAKRETVRESESVGPRAQSRAARTLCGTLQRRAAKSHQRYHGDTARRRLGTQIGRAV